MTITFDIQLFLCHPIRKLLVLCLHRGNYVHRYRFFYFSSFIFKENHVLVEEGNLSEKNVIVKKELDGIDINDIGNLEDLLIKVFIHEECGNLKVFVDGRELNRIINEKKSQVLYKLTDVHSVTNASCESISAISMWNIVNQ